MNTQKFGKAINSLNGPASLLIRHAERPIIPFGEVDHLIKITDNGRKSAEDLGKLIGNRLDNIATSSVPRCLDTSEAIVYGSGKREMEININWRLGNPGIWITDGEAAWVEFIKKGLNKIIKYQVEGKTLNGFRSMEEGMEIMMDYIFRDSSDHDGINLFVSHDAVIAPFIGYILGITDPVDILPGFLDGILLILTENGMKVFWKDRWYETSKGVK